MTNRQLRKELNSIFRKEKVKSRMSFGYRFEDACPEDFERQTSYFGKKPVIIFSIPDNDEVVSFYNYVESIIDAEHEIKHCRQLNDMKKSRGVTDELISFVPTLYNHDYYVGTYEYCSHEVDAEIYGLEKAREYLHMKYQGHEDDIDRHIMDSGRAWFSNVSSDIGIDYVSSEFDVFVGGLKKYKDSLMLFQPVFEYAELSKSNDVIAQHLLKNYAVNRISLMDEVFLHADNGWEQRKAAFVITACEKKDWKDMFPRLGSVDCQLKIPVREDIVLEDNFDDYVY